MKFLSETFGKVGGAGKAYFKCHFQDAHGGVFQEFRTPFEAVGADKFRGRFAA